MPQAGARALRVDDERAAPPEGAGDESVRAAAGTSRRTVTITGRPDPAPPRRHLSPVPALDAPTPRRRSLAGRTPRLVEIDRRRPPRRPQERVASRPDRVALWALFMALFLILAVATSSHAAPRLGARTVKAGMHGHDVRVLQRRLRRLHILHAPATGWYGPATRSAVRRYQRSRCLGVDGIAGPATIRALARHRRSCHRRAHRRRRTRPATFHRLGLGHRTLARGMAGRDVRTLQRLLGLSPDGHFGAGTRRAVVAFQRAAGLGSDGRVGPRTRAALIGRRMHARRATWYGPGFYGKRTACGLTLTTRLRGVAHRSLPCGHPVTIYYRGHFTTVPVVDRGPYTSGVALDLTGATATALGLSGVDRLRVRY